jgi:hypothetical protein
MDPDMQHEEKGNGLGKTLAKGIAQHQVTRVKDRVEYSTVDFRLEAGHRIEGLAEQIRQLGNRFDNPEEAHVLARRLERLADYLRFRPSSEIAVDVWEAARRYHLLWIAGGIFGAALLYRLSRRSKG